MLRLGLPFVVPEYLLIFFLSRPLSRQLFAVDRYREVFGLLASHTVDSSTLSRLRRAWLNRLRKSQVWS